MANTPPRMAAESDPRVIQIKQTKPKFKPSKLLADFKGMALKAGQPERAGSIVDIERDFYSIIWHPESQTNWIEIRCEDAANLPIAKLGIEGLGYQVFHHGNHLMVYV